MTFCDPSIMAPHCGNADCGPCNRGERSAELGREIKDLFTARQKAWENQGRNPEDKWAVENFRTGQGYLLVNDLVGLVEREREAAAEEARAPYLAAGEVLADFFKSSTKMMQDAMDVTHAKYPDLFPPKP
jgi:hypothetical protein